MAGPRVKYGFRLNAARDGLLVDEEKMSNVRRIFRMVGTEGHSLNAVYKTFERERIPTPGGGKRWDRAFFRVAILDDVYRPHTYEEVEELVSPEGGGTPGPRAALRRLVVQPAQGAHPAGIRTIRERPALP